MTAEASDASVEAVAAYLTGSIGLSTAGSRRSHLLREIRDAMARAGTASADAYQARLENDDVGFAALVARITVGESYFFREPRQLDVLRSVILPERRAARGGDTPLRLWSAGCAIGQEAYTLAILLEEEGVAGRITATDLSRQALRVARDGVYGKWSLRAVSDHQRATYFHPVGTGYRVDERFGAAISFRELNLLDSHRNGPRNVDVALCRNVLIYFTPEAVVRAVTELAAALAPGGWLITGAADPPLNGIGGLHPTPTPAGIMYRRLDADAGDDSRVPRATSKLRPRPVSTSASAPRRPSPARAPRTGGSPPRPAADESAEGAARVVRSLGGTGDLAAAAAAVADAVDRFPLHTELRYLEAIVLLELGRPADAATSARAVLYLDPGLVMGHLALARAEAALGNADRAKRSLRTAAELLASMADDDRVPMSDGERASRVAAMIAAHDRVVT